MNSDHEAVERGMSKGRDDAEEKERLRHSFESRASSDLVEGVQQHHGSWIRDEKGRLNEDTKNVHDDLDDLYEREARTPMLQ